MQKNLNQNKLWFNANKPPIYHTLLFSLILIVILPLLFSPNLSCLLCLLYMSDPYPSLALFCTVRKIWRAAENTHIHRGKTKGRTVEERRKRRSAV